MFRRGVSMRSLRWLGWMWRWIRRLHRHRRVGKKCVAPLAISPSPQRSLRPSVDTLALERSSCVFSHHSFSLSKTLSHSLSLSLSLSPQVGTPPLLDFSKLKSYESPHTTARYSAHGSMDQPPSPSTPTTLRYPEDAGGAAASGGGYPHTPSCVIRSRGGGFVVYRMCTAPAEPVSGELYVPGSSPEGPWTPGGALEAARIQYWLGGVRYLKQLPNCSETLPIAPAPPSKWVPLCHPHVLVLPLPTQRLRGGQPRAGGASRWRGKGWVHGGGGESNPGS